MASWDEVSSEADPPGLSGAGRCSELGDAIAAANGSGASRHDVISSGDVESVPSIVIVWGETDRENDDGDALEDVEGSSGDLRVAPSLPSAAIGIDAEAAPRSSSRGTGVKARGTASDSSANECETRSFASWIKCGSILTCE